jgi:hypothetical protein
MIQVLALVLSLTPLFAQENFSRYCGHIAAPAPSHLRPNTKVFALAAVVDAARGMPKRMRDAVARGMSYEEFKEQMAGEQISISDHYHQASFEDIARSRCETNESSVGEVSIQAHNAPTREQLGRRVDDSGIGVGGPAVDGTGTSGSETDR